MGRTGTDLVRLMSGGTVAVALVQCLEAKMLSHAKAGSGKYPMVRLQHLIGRDGHCPRIGENDSEQIGFRFDMGMKAALKSGRPGIKATHGLAAVEVFHGTVKAIAAQIKEATAPLEDP